MEGSPGGEDRNERLPGDPLIDLVREKAAELRSGGIVAPEVEERLDAHARSMGS